MEAISALETAACILAITEFITELLLTSQSSKVQLPLSLDGKDEHTIWETLQKLENCTIRYSNPFCVAAAIRECISTIKQCPALREPISPGDAFTALLEDIKIILRRPPDEPRSEPLGTDTRTWLRSRLADTLGVEKLERLSHAVTHQVSSILSSRISELSQTVESLENEGRYARPEHESRVDAMSCDLEDLRLEVQKRLASLDASCFAAFMEADVKILSARCRATSPGNS